MSEPRSELLARTRVGGHGERSSSSRGQGRRAERGELELVPSAGQAPDQPSSAAALILARSLLLTSLSRAMSSSKYANLPDIVSRHLVHTYESGRPSPVRHELSHGSSSLKLTCLPSTYHIGHRSRCVRDGRCA